MEPVSLKNIKHGLMGHGMTNVFECALNSKRTIWRLKNPVYRIRPC